MLVENLDRVEAPKPISLPPGLKVNVGCGPVQPAGWVNMDNSNRAWLAKRLWPVDRFLVKCGVLPPTEFGRNVTLHNLLKPLPFAAGSVSCIYAGEVWEHFEYADAARLTAECFRVLAPGGVLRVRVPDGVSFWRQYLNLVEAELAKPREEWSAKKVRDHVQMYFDHIQTRKSVLKSIGHKHKWDFDEVQLIKLFEDNGFRSVERRNFRDSRIPDVDRVENYCFLIVEGVKPD
jgi:predicted SAM-dependent methyltransferase